MQLDEPFEREGVRGTLHRPEHPAGAGMVLTHGAGTNANAPLLVGLSRAFCEAGWTVLRYDLPYRVARPQGPPMPAAAARDREGVVHAVAALREIVSGRVWAGGHSYGGRQSAMAAAENPGLCDGLLLLSYPLHPPRQPEKLRTGYFPEWRTPALFVHGTRDPFGTVAELRTAIRAIPAHVDMIEVEGAGHELKGKGDKANWPAGLAESILSRMLF